MSWQEELNKKLEAQRAAYKESIESGVATNRRLSYVAKLGGKASEKISMEIATEIRKLYATGNYTQIDLAKKYRFKGSSTISDIILNVTYYDKNYNPEDGYSIKRNNIYNSILDLVNDEFTNSDITNIILELELRDNKKAALKYARRITGNSDYCIKIHEGKKGCNIDVHKFKKVIN